LQSLNPSFISKEFPMIFGKSNIEKAEDSAAVVGKQLAKGVENAANSVNDVAQTALSSVAVKLDAIHDQATPAVDRMLARGQDMANTAINSTRQAGVSVKKTMSDYTSACEVYVTEQPMRSVAIAAAAGATIAALILMSRNRAINNRSRGAAR
jgi:ElaB/YqjD/DUF883 family membrane-anchored ribosome-binding protein